MFTRVSVLIPTRGRVARLTTLLASYARTSDQAVSELVFKVDQDDRDTIAFLSGKPHQLVIGPRRGGYASLPEFFNEMAAAASGDVLMCGNDDMVFQTPGWAEKILEVANRYPDGLFDIGVSTFNPTHYPFATVSRRVVEALGFIWDPTIFWGDMYLRDVMQALGRCVMVPAVQIDHDWEGFKAQPDQVFMESDKDITSRDPNYWDGTHRVAVQAAVATLRRLRT